MDAIKRRGAHTRTARRRGAPARGPRGSRGERRRLVQLLVSLALFFLVFVGRGVFPRQLQAWGRLLTSDVDFGTAWQQFQSALEEGEGVQQALSQFGAAVLGAPAQDAPEAERTDPARITLLSQTSRVGLDYVSQAGVWTVEPAPAQDPAPQASQPEPEAEPSPEVVTAVAQAYTDDGVALPSNVSFAYYELGLEKTAVPVQGSVTSTFGYRDSPINGEKEFHLALDIGAEEGTEIGAFADGVVEYIGQSDEFGLYLQIQHANQVATFYAHCSKLLVNKGDPVQCGQTVALVGATGNVTGPHLHFTILKDGVRLDPAYYVDLS